MRVGVLQIGGDDHHPHQREADEEGPQAVEALAEQTGKGAEQADQREGAQAGAGCRLALALQPQHESDAEGDQDGLELARVEGQVGCHSNGVG